MRTDELWKMVNDMNKMRKKIQEYESALTDIAQFGRKQTSHGYWLLAGLSMTQREVIAKVNRARKALRRHTKIEQYIKQLRSQK